MRVETLRIPASAGDVADAGRMGVEGVQWKAQRQGQEAGLVAHPVAVVRQGGLLACRVGRVAGWVETALGFGEELPKAAGGRAWRRATAASRRCG